MSEDAPTGLSRRCYLAGVVAGVGLLAGCTSAEETPPGIGRITIENRRDRPIQAWIAYEQNGEQHETTVSLGTGDAGGAVRRTIVEPWMGEHGDWELLVDAAGVEGRYSSESFDERFYDWNATDCLLVSVRIDDDISITPRTAAVDCP